MEEIKRAMLEDDDEDENYLDSLRQNSGSGLINTRISDRENEVISAFTEANVISTASSFNLCLQLNNSINRRGCIEHCHPHGLMSLMEKPPCTATRIS